MRAHLLGVLAPTALTPEQYFVLMRLAQRDGAQQGELGDPALDDRASISRQVALLQTRGLLVRSAHPDDGRSLAVHLTDEGTALLASLTAAVQEQRERLFGDLPLADLAALHRVLDHLERCLEGGR